MRNKLAYGSAVFVFTFVALTGLAFATAPTATSIATDTATAIKDQFLPAMVAAIPIILVLVVAKRVYRWVRGQA